MSLNAELPLLLEIKRRRRIRNSFLDWCRACGFEPARHHCLLIERIQALVSGRAEKRKLAIFLPPGSAKSTYTSVLLPPWFLAQKPDTAILAASHSFDLAESFGRRSRNLVDLHGKELGYTLKADSKAAWRWETTKGGLFYCAGVGAGIAGRRADLGLIDDPIGKKEDADSKLLRDKQWDWYNYDFLPRLKPDALQVLIQTRWHEDDLAGRILNSEGGDWEVVRLPFFAEEADLLGRDSTVENGSRNFLGADIPYPKGEMLWPEWYKKEMFPKDPRVGQTLYQNNPTPEDGNFFDAAGLLTYGPADLPRNLRYYAGSDHACSELQQADRTCLLVVGVDEHRRIWVMPDWFWQRADTAKTCEAMLRLNQKYAPTEWWAERGHITKSIGPFLRNMMQETGNYIALSEVTSARDKVTRAQSMHARIRNKMVLFPAYAPDWPAARAEMLRFPNGTNDDFVDALSEIGMGLDRLVTAVVPSPASWQQKCVLPEREGLPTLGEIRASHRRKERALALQDW